MRTKGVVFINKSSADSGNVSQSTHEERRLINRENRTHRRATQQKFAKAAWDRSSTPVGTPPRVQTPETIHLDGSHLSSHVRRPSPPRRVLSSTSQHTTEHYTAVVPRLTTLGPLSAPVDPFDSYGIRVDSSLAKILQFYEETYHELMFDNIQKYFRYEFDMDALGICSPKTVIAESLSEPMRLYPLCVNVAAHLQYVEGIDLQTMIPELMQQALHFLQRKLAKSPSTLQLNTLLSAFHFFMTAYTGQDRKVMRAHIKGCRAILEQMKDAQLVLAAPTIVMMAIIDVDAPEYWFGLLPEKERPRLLLHNVDEQVSPTLRQESRFFDDAHRNVVDMHIANIIKRCQMFSAKWSARHKKNKSFAIQQAQLEFERSTLSHAIILTEVSKPSAVTTVLLQALSVWPWLADASAAARVHQSAERCKELLFEMSFDEWAGAQDILLWICVVAGMAAKPGSFTQRYFVRRAIIQQNVLVLPQDPDDEAVQRQHLRDFAEKFLWFGAEHDVKLNAVSWKP